MAVRFAQEDMLIEDASGIGTSVFISWAWLAEFISFLE
jgi:hypothetical protein